jgi:hypothetical protein
MAVPSFASTFKHTPHIIASDLQSHIKVWTAPQMSLRKFNGLLEIEREGLAEGVSDIPVPARQGGGTMLVGPARATGAAPRLFIYAVLRLL